MPFAAIAAGLSLLQRQSPAQEAHWRYCLAPALPVKSAYFSVAAIGCGRQSMIVLAKSLHAETKRLLRRHPRYGEASDTAFDRPRPG